MSWCLGIEIGGTKLQIGLGQGERAEFRSFWRGTIEAGAGAAAIRDQIAQQLPLIVAEAGLTPQDIAGVGVSFGGPVDTVRGMTMVSHQVSGWKDFPLVEWLQQKCGWPVALQNDADSAALAEATFGAGRGYDPVLYLTVGSGIGGGLVNGGRIYRGAGTGAVEIGHLRPGALPRHVPLGGETVEDIASGFGITARARRTIRDYFDTANYVKSQFAQTTPQAHPADGLRQVHDPRRQRFARLWELAGQNPESIDTRMIAQAASEGDALSAGLLADATHAIGWAIAQAVTLLNPARIVIGGGVSLIGDDFFFEPVRQACRQFAFPPFVDQAQIVPAELGEEVVVHGAVAIAAAAFLHKSP